MSVFSALRHRALLVVFLCTMACPALIPPAHADSDYDLEFFKTTTCSASQIFRAIEKVAPEEMKQIRSGPIGSRRQKWLMNWLTHTLEAVGAGAATPSFADATGGQFGDADWRKFFHPHKDEIAQDCVNE